MLGEKVINKVVHSLARHVINVFDLTMWMKDVLSQFVFVLQGALANFP